MWNQVQHWSIRTSASIQNVNLALPACTNPINITPTSPEMPSALFSSWKDISSNPQKDLNELPQPIKDKCKLPFLRMLLFSRRKISRWWKTPKRCFHQTDPVSHLSKVMTWIELVVFLSLTCVFLNFWRPKCRPCGEKLKANLQSFSWVVHADNLHTTQYFRSKTLSVYEVSINYPLTICVCLHFLRAGW